MIFNHSQIDHQSYSLVVNDKYISDLNPDGVNYDNPSDGTVIVDMNADHEHQLPSMWYTLQKIKDIMLYLKNLPYCGPDKGIMNQYDNTNIYVISDHGNVILHDANNSSQHYKMIKFLLNKNLLSESQFQILVSYITNKESYPMINSMCLRKPRKYVNNPNWNKPIGKTGMDKLKGAYDSQALITTGDLMPLIESDLELVKKDINNDSDKTFDKSKSYFNPNGYYDLNPNMSNEDRQWLDEYWKDNLVIDPLNNKDALWNRKIISTSVNWHFYPNDKAYKNIFYSYIFNPKDNYSEKQKSIFDISLYSTIWY